MLEPGKPLLFLDFDGVLHPAYPRQVRTPEENRLYACLPRLEAVLRQYPDWRIVISSSWREHRPWEDVIRPFSPDIAARIVGGTPVLKRAEPPYPPYPRYEEIRQFLAERGEPETRWLALDDEARLYPPDCQRLVLCADGFGPEEERVLRIKMAESAGLVLYLDFDGVLHPWNTHPSRGQHRFFQWAGLLEAALAPYPALRIVLSTAWVVNEGYAFARDALPPGLRARVIGATYEAPDLAWQGMPRYAQIAAHAARHQLRHWMAVDDNTADWPEPLCRRLLRCDMLRGLSKPETQVQLADALVVLHEEKP